MPFITAREDAGLSRTPNSQDIDALVPGGHRIAVDWVQHQDDGNGLGQVRLAGNYTCPETHMMLNVGDLRFINCTRFEIPSSAWLAKVKQSDAIKTMNPEQNRARPEPSSDPILVSDEICRQIFGRAVTHSQLIDLNSCLDLFEINTQPRMAHFMAQIAHESGGLRWLKEIADGSDYEGRTDLGNNRPGDGPRYKGAGAIQLTGRNNYEKLSKFIRDPKVMDGCEYVASKYPFTSAGFWWHNNGMNQRVDEGASCRKISSIVNGKDPAIGLEEREAYFEKAVTALRSSANPTATIKEEPREASTDSIRTTFNPSDPIDWLNPKCKVSRYFTVAEVTQGDQRRIPSAGSQEERNILRLALELDKVREAWGSPIGVTSWFRPAAVNAEVGGVSNSQHIPGLAADIYTMDATDQYHPRNREFEEWLDRIAWCDRALGYGCAAN